jgi:hypothetical protein
MKNTKVRKRNVSGMKTGGLKIKVQTTSKTDNTIRHRPSAGFLS